MFTSRMRLLERSKTNTADLTFSLFDLRFIIKEHLGRNKRKQHRGINTYKVLHFLSDKSRQPEINKAAQKKKDVSFVCIEQICINNTEKQTTKRKTTFFLSLKVCFQVLRSGKKSFFSLRGNGYTVYTRSEEKRQVIRRHCMLRKNRVSLRHLFKLQVDVFSGRFSMRGRHVTERTSVRSRLVRFGLTLI